MVFVCHHQAFHKACIAKEASEGSSCLVPSQAWLCEADQGRPLQAQRDPPCTSFSRPSSFEINSQSNVESTVAVWPLQENGQGDGKQLQPLWRQLARRQPWLHTARQGQVSEEATESVGRELGILGQLWQKPAVFPARCELASTAQISQKRPIQDWEGQTTKAMDAKVRKAKGSKIKVQQDRRATFQPKAQPKVFHQNLLGDLHCRVCLPCHPCHLLLPHIRSPRSCRL